MDPLARDAFASVQRTANLASLAVGATSAPTNTGSDPYPRAWQAQERWQPVIEHVIPESAGGSRAESSHVGFDLARLVIALVGLSVQLALVAGLIAGAAYLILP